MVTQREFNRPQSNRCDAAEREDIFQVLRGAGVEFIDENGGGPGVRRKKPPKKRT
jgi:hypothetical protein